MPASVFSIAFVVVMLWSAGVSAQCVGGAEVCLQESSDSVFDTAEVTSSDNGVTLVDENTTETFTDEQAQLVAGITHDLKRRSLTLPRGNNALEKIAKLREIHPGHDYSVNGEKYIARILMLMGRQALRRGDLDLASRRLLKAIKFDPAVGRQAQLKKGIAEAARALSTQAETDSSTLTDYLPSNTAINPSIDTTGNTASYKTSAAAAINPTPTEPVVDSDKFAAPVMVAIPAGIFLMGSDSGAADEKPVHEVSLEAFSMSKHEITMQQFRAFALATSRPAPQYADDEGNLPVTNVSWRDALAYTAWLSDKTKRPFRLPTESEWEYAARAGTTTNYSSGDLLTDAANCVGCGGQWSGKSAAPVGSFNPNEFGLYDVHGNVWEWVQDCWTDNYNGRTNSAAPVEVEGCERRVLRGGSWYNDADYARSSYRGNETQQFRDEGVGFRVVYDGL